VLLRREGWRVNANRVYRLYREMGLQLRNITPKRRVKGKLREDRRPATRSNETWAMDFVHDQLATGTKLRVLTIVDTFSCFSPAIEPRFNFRGAEVVIERYHRSMKNRILLENYYLPGQLKQNIGLRLWQRSPYVSIVIGHHSQTSSGCNWALISPSFGMKVIVQIAEGLPALTYRANWIERSIDWQTLTGKMSSTAWAALRDSKQ
jgi:hypothetical protein